MLDTKDPDEIIHTVLLLQPAFGGVNLEDLSQPKCFRILDTLREKAEIPIWHDDQQGTACVTLAGLLNALKIVGKPINEVAWPSSARGAANVAISRLCFRRASTRPSACMVDSKGILHRDREDIVPAPGRVSSTSGGCARSPTPKAARAASPRRCEGADVCIALSQPGPGTIKPEWVSAMAHDAIIFACANPVPEIWPWEAKAAGARIVATGRSDFPNQVNNRWVSPASSGARSTCGPGPSPMRCVIAAAEALAGAAPDGGMDPHSHPADHGRMGGLCPEAVAVGMKAQEQGIARPGMSAEELFKRAAAA